MPLSDQRRVDGQVIPDRRGATPVGTAPVGLSGHGGSPALAVSPVGDDLDPVIAAQALLDLFEHVWAIAGDDEQVADGRLRRVRHAAGVVHGRRPRWGRRPFGVFATSNAHAGCSVTRNTLVCVGALGAPRIPSISVPDGRKASGTRTAMAGE